MKTRWPLAVIKVLLMMGPAAAVKAEHPTLRVAAFNASMEGGNYVVGDSEPTGGELPRVLASGDHPQLRNIARIIQSVRPDILLLNEFDYTADPQGAIDAFRQRYLSIAQGDAAAINYPHAFSAPVNTGVDSGFDLNRDGSASGRGQDAWGYGLYPGQYGMVLLSRYPLQRDRVRTFRSFRWQDMPGNLLTAMVDASGDAWYPPAVRERMPLSSKSHWDIPIAVGGETVHILASHPTPPVFDGPEDRNGRRNHDEIRFWSDYLSGDGKAAYLYDDDGGRGGLQGRRFVILGDLNASPAEGDARPAAIAGLLAHPTIDASLVPTSRGATAARPANPHAASHTASWGQRADYVLPSRAGWELLDGGVYWPAPGEPDAELVIDRAASSDHRLVWLDLALHPFKGDP
jgi:endonuclease/exonuclease/phosphatase family metal-dependent hydrolase